MPVFVRNLSLEYLVEGGVLNQERMLQMFHAARWRDAHGAFYLNHTLPSGVQFIFHVIPDGADVRIIGTDTHLAGDCIWHAVPFFNATPRDADDLSSVVACTNQAQDGVFVTHLMNAGVLQELQEGESITMQVVAFPLNLFCYASREEYEKSVGSTEGPAHIPMLLTDRRIFPLNFMLKHDPEVPPENRDQSLPDDVVLCCGPILSVRQAPPSEVGQEVSFIVATIDTQFGHLDVAFAPNMCVGARIEAGSYLVFNGILSGNVAIEGLESWLD